jgi:hypothetical protein
MRIAAQGYDFEVLKGADGMMKDGRVGLVFIEIIFSRLYEGLPRFDAIYGFLADRGFRLVTFYDIQYDNNNLASWADALFIHERDGRA